MAASSPSLEVRKIFVVIDPRRLVQAALEKGEWIAQGNGAELELYCAVDPENAADAEAQARLIQRTHEWIERVVETSRAAGRKIFIRVEADRDWRAAIARAASTSGADLVIKTASPRGPLRRRLMQTGDWTLLRNCSLPILLASPTQIGTPNTVLAAVKVNPENDTYVELNRRVMALGHRISGLLEAELHAVTVYRGEGIYFDRQKFADECGLPRNRVHAVEGSSYEGIAQVAAQLGAGAVIVGSAPRPSRGSVLGATAERVIDEVPGDVLVVPAV